MQIANSSLAIPSDACVIDIGVIDIRHPARANSSRHSRRSHAILFHSVSLMLFVLVGAGLAYQNFSDQGPYTHAARTLHLEAVASYCPAARVVQSSGRIGSDPVAGALSQAASVYGLDESLLLAIMVVESRCNPQARSNRGAVGLMQLMPSTADWLGVRVNDSRENILGGAKYMAMLLKQFNGDIERALAAYNAGPATIRKYNGIPPYRETKHFIRKVLHHYLIFQAIARENDRSLFRRA